MNLKFVGNTLIASLFIASAIKIIFFGFDDFVDAVKSKNLPFPLLVTLIVLCIKIFGGLSLVFDYKSVYGATMLLIFTVLATILFHNAFKDPGEFNSMFKNIAIIGGLILIIERSGLFIVDVTKHS